MPYRTRQHATEPDPQNDKHSRHRRHTEATSTMLHQPIPRPTGKGQLQPHTIMQMQRHYGNRAVQRFLAHRAPVQNIQRCGSGDNCACAACSADHEEDKSSQEPASPLQRTLVRRFWGDDDQDTGDSGGIIESATDWVGDAATSVADWASETASGAADWASESMGGGGAAASESGNYGTPLNETIYEPGNGEAAPQQEGSFWDDMTGGIGEAISGAGEWLGGANASVEDATGGIGLDDMAAIALQMLGGGKSDDPEDDSWWPEVDEETLELLNDAKLILAPLHATPDPIGTAIHFISEHASMIQSVQRAFDLELQDDPCMSDSEYTSLMSNGWCQTEKTQIDVLAAQFKEQKQAAEKAASDFLDDTIVAEALSCAGALASGAGGPVGGALGAVNCMHSIYKALKTYKRVEVEIAKAESTAAKYAEAQKNYCQCLKARAEEAEE